MDNKTKQAMQMALEALESVGEQTFFQDGWNGVNKLNATITALREALCNASERMAQPQVVTEGNASEVRSTDTGEPVADVTQHGIYRTVAGLNLPVGTKLYTTPPSVEAMRIETLEKAAKVCESYIVEGIGREMAAAIRSMK
jgi:hypothetical protein